MTDIGWNANGNIDGNFDGDFDRKNTRVFARIFGKNFGRVFARTINRNFGRNFGWKIFWMDQRNQIRAGKRHNMTQKSYWRALLPCYDAKKKVLKNKDFRKAAIIFELDDG